MNEHDLRVLILEDQTTDAELMQCQLREAGLRLRALRVDSRAAFEQALVDFVPDLVIADFNLPQFDGLSAVRLMRQRQLETPLIIVTGTLPDERAVELLRDGASDYILKDRLARLAPAVTRALADAASARQLSVSEQRYRNLFESSRDALMTSAPPSWRFTSANRAMLEMFRAESVAQLIALAPWQLSPARQPDGQPSEDKAKAMIAQAMRDGAHRFEWEHQRFDGELFAANVSLTRIDSDGGGFLLASVHDISARVHAEHLLRASEARYRGLAESLRDTVYRCDPQTFQTSYINRAAQTLYGYSAEEWAADPGLLMKAVHPADLARVADYFARMQREGELAPLEYRVVTKAGDLRWVEDRPSYERDENGRIVALTGVISDITRRRAETEARRASEARYRALAEAAHDLITLIDAGGVYAYANSCAAELFGRPVEAIVGKRIAELFDAESAARQQASVDQVLSTGEALYAEEQLSFAGHTRWLGTSLTPVEDGQGKPVSVLVISRDISQRKKAEQELDQLTASLESQIEQRTLELARAKEQAEAANRAKSEFLAIMSHEIRTPMNGVLGMVEILRRCPLEPEARDAADTIAESALALLQIINDILDFSKIEAGRLELAFCDCCLSELLESICHALVPYAAGLGVDLDLMIEPAVPDAVRTDPERLRRVLTNLIGNGIKFSGGRRGQRGRVRTRVSVEQVEPLRLCFNVTDNGIGMSQDVLGQLFTPFSQAESTTTRRYGGTGLGLAIVKRLLGLFQGEVTVNSTPGSGSTFFVRMPFERAATQPCRPALDIAGLDCIVVAGGDLEADDLSSHLRSAGANPSVVADAALAAAQASRLTLPIIVQAPGRACVATNDLLGPFAQLRQARHVLIRRGMRRSVRSDGANLVTLDGDALPRHALLRAIAVAAGRAEADVDAPPVTAGRTTVSLPALAAARARGEWVLVAEDNEINQKVILRQLALLGYAADVASDGAAALALWRRQHHPLLISDLHMPELDGYGLVAAIRAEEPAAARTAIIALTADAQRSEAERALAAGFDEFLTKPTQLEALHVLLKKWLPLGDESANRGQSAENIVRALPANHATLLDLDVLKQLIGDDDPSIIRSLLIDYRHSLVDCSQGLIAARAVDDPARLAAIAHKLKSSSRSVGALDLGNASEALEDAGRNADLPTVARTIDRVMQALAAVEAELDARLAEDTPPQ